jgi:2'-5' RNA ligase
MVVPVMRAFCALNLDLASVRRLHGTALALQAEPEAPSGTRWVPPTRMHVTLKFFGDVDVGLGPALVDAIAPLADAESVLRAPFSRLEAFPRGERARVVVAMLDDAAGELRRLAEAVEEAASRLGFEREARPYQPHATLARLGRPTDVRRWLDAVRVPTEPATVTELVLYRSDFTPAGNEYVALGRFAVGAA